MNMHKRIIILVSGALFALLALLAGIITDLNDREFPQAIGSKSRLNMNFTESGFSINEAFSKLEELNARLDLGLVKIAPDLANDGEGEIFAALTKVGLPNKFTWFNGSDTGKVVGKDRLSNSYPDGFYLVTGNMAHLDEFVNALQDAGVEITRRDAAILDSLVFVVQERGFITVILASLALISSLALFWLSVRARGRAIQVLGGSPTGRIQMQDLTDFGGALFISAGMIAMVAASYVGIFHGWMYVSTFLKILISIQIVVIAISIVAALIMSASAWPSAAMLATRQPAVKSLRRVSFVIQALTFVLVVSFATPAWSSYKNSAAKATEMAQWKKLSDQVSIAFALDVDEMDRVESKIGKVVKGADSVKTVALSYTYTKEMWPSVDFDDYSAVSFVNQRWLDLVTISAENSVVNAVTHEDLSKDLVVEIHEAIDLLSRETYSENLFKQIQFYEPIEGFRIPVAQGGGGESLRFGDDILLVVIPSLYNTYNDSALTSMLSSSNVMFTGATATQQLLAQHGLDGKALRDQGIKGELKVVYVAEDGILQAQFAAYLVWLQNLSLIALVVAFSVATAISALITATLQAKRDFPLRLAGQAWGQIIGNRMTKELFAAIILLGMIVMLQKPTVSGVLISTGTYALLLIPLSHLLAVRWCFNGVSKRKL
ncbi:heme/copper-type cytochrome/quinol oxidase subunit 2 [Sporosarcina luteola]|nr:heme/copper-type cytochrome/quinol oxidase subunit 2 [Sporosarcina luteola]